MLARLTRYYIKQNEINGFRIMRLFLFLNYPVSQVSKNGYAE